MSWAGPEDIYLSTSLASYLDSEHPFFLSFFSVMLMYTSNLIIYVKDCTLEIVIPAFIFGSCFHRVMCKG